MVLAQPAHAPRQGKSVVCNEKTKVVDGIKKEKENLLNPFTFYIFMKGKQYFFICT